MLGVFKWVFGANQKKASQDRIKSIKKQKTKEKSQCAKAHVTEVKTLRTLPAKTMEFATEIYKYLRRVERVFAPRQDYTTSVGHSFSKERVKVVEWMINLVDKYSLKRQTLSSAVSLFDRYVELKEPTEVFLGMIAQTCLLIAYKYEEIAYHAKDILETPTYQGHHLSTDAIYNCELDILDSLGWRLNHLGMMSFFEVLSSNLPITESELALAENLSSILLLTGISTKLQNSLAASALIYMLLTKHANQDRSRKYSVQTTSNTVSIHSEAEHSIDFCLRDIWTLEMTIKSLYNPSQVADAAALLKKELYLASRQTSNKKLTANILEVLSHLD